MKRSELAAQVLALRNKAVYRQRILKNPNWRVYDQSPPLPLEASTCRLLRLSRDAVEDLGRIFRDAYPSGVFHDPFFGDLHDLLWDPVERGSANDVAFVVFDFLRTKRLWFGGREGHSDPFESLAEAIQGNHGESKRSKTAGSPVAASPTPGVLRPRQLNDSEQAIVDALREANRRMTGPVLSNKALGKYDGQAKGILASLVKEKVLDNRQDLRPRGYGLPQWSAETGP